MGPAPVVPDLSVVITTYNRADLLPRALDSLLVQDLAPARYEIVVVDNNSTDHTRRVVESFAGRAPAVRYAFEPSQGIAYGRNRGIRAAVGPVIAFTDDDVRVDRNWTATILDTLAAHPEVLCVGGRVLPDWEGAWPKWLTKEHWGPLALLDYGETPLYVSAERQLCLITANVAYRREFFERLGMFAPHMLRSSDHEILVRMWRAGGRGLYWPELTATAEIDPERMRRRYHRRWHRRHGRFAALMRDEALERTRVGHVLGVPAHVYRRGLTSFASWATHILRGDLAKAFTYEVDVWSCVGFMAARWREVLAGHGGTHGRPGR